jgi:tRNA dimethylallyltransferase
VEAPLVVIVGPTASGKSGLAVELAERYRGEIICADSRTVYKGMDIGTAKPTATDRARVPHWGLDVVEPGEPFSAADFKSYAEQKIAEIRARGNVPFLVGGTGLYVDAVVFNYQFGDAADTVRRAELNTWTIEQLQDYCKENNISLPENQQNKRHLIRAIEQGGINNNRQNTPVKNTIIVGIATNKDTLAARIHERSEHLFTDGVVDEANRLGKKYGWNSEAMTGNIYRLVREFNEGTLDEAALKEAFERSDRQLAKRQLTWLKRNPFIHWLSLEQAREFIGTHLAS